MKPDAIPDEALLNWLEEQQASITTANHKFIVSVHSDRDPNNTDSLRRAIQRAMPPQPPAPAEPTAKLADRSLRFLGACKVVSILVLCVLTLPLALAVLLILVSLKTWWSNTLLGILIPLYVVIFVWVMSGSSHDSTGNV